MAEIIRMPRLSDTMEEGIILEWFKKVGEEVSTGDILAEVETDKATMELESFQDGILLHIGIEKGAVPVDALIAIVGEKGENIDDILAAEAESGGKKETSKDEQPATSKAEQAPESKPTTQTVVKSISKEAAPNPSTDSRIKASPLAKKMAEDAGINLSSVPGSGDNGRIIRRDIENFTPTQSAKTTPSISLNPDVQYGDIPVSQMRKTIARRLGESKFSAPHFYLTMEVNMDNAVRARKAVNDQGGVKVSFNDIIVKASALALRKHPMVNASWHGDKMTVHEHVNIGVAVAVAEGLLVPVVRDADLKPLSAITQEIRALAEKAKDKKLSLDEMQGNTFTISNLGMFGIEEFTAIINPPDACILAVGGIIKKPVVKNNEIVVGNVMKITLSCDHRIVDGVVGSQFLNTLKSYLETPLMMLV